MESKLEEKLKKEGVSNIKFYYCNIPIIGNVYTACLIFSESKELLARGVAICSVMDCHNKEIGREKSKSRALNALFKKNNSLKISTPNEIMNDKNRAYLAHIKTFRIKNDKQKEIIETQLKEFELDYKIKPFGEKEEIIIVDIPYFITVVRTQFEFDYKSEFKPEPTDKEKKMFKL